MKPGDVGLMAVLGREGVGFWKVFTRSRRRRAGARWVPAPMPASRGTNGLPENGPTTKHHLWVVTYLPSTISRLLAGALTAARPKYLF